MNATLTADVLRLLVDYQPDTGVFTRKVRSSSNAMPGAKAGCKRTKRRCVEFRVSGRLYKAHRLAWLYVTGEWPSHEIDHIDGNPYNNSFSNLRDVPRQVNGQNLKRATAQNKTTGVLGACLIRSSGMFKAQISVDGVTRNLGHFETAAEAHTVYVAAKRRLHEGNTL